MEGAFIWSLEILFIRQISRSERHFIESIKYSIGCFTLDVRSSWLFMKMTGGGPAPCLSLPLAKQTKANSIVIGLRFMAYDHSCSLRERREGVETETTPRYKTYALSIKKRNRRRRRRRRRRGRQCNRIIVRWR